MRFVRSTSTSWYVAIGVLRLTRYTPTRTPRTWGIGWARTGRTICGLSAATPTRGLMFDWADALR